ncbi:hypothetical protein J7L13_00870 [bacterium]|nr:hypothetical protein [bacterium]
MRKSKEAFTRNWLAHRDAVKLVIDLLEKRGHTVLINTDVFKMEKRTKPKHEENADLYDATEQRLIEVTSTFSEAIFIPTKRLNAMVVRDMLIYIVFWELDEIRCIEAAELAGLIKRGKFKIVKNRYREECYLFNREVAPLVAKISEVNRFGKLEA